MTHAIFQKMPAPFFAHVEILGNVRHQCALVMPANIAGVQLVGVTFFKRHDDKPETKYYGAGSIYAITPRPTFEARGILDDGQYLALLELLSPDTTVWSSFENGMTFSLAGALAATERARLAAEAEPPPEDTPGADAAADRSEDIF